MEFKGKKASLRHLRRLRDHKLAQYVVTYTVDFDADAPRRSRVLARDARWRGSRATRERMDEVAEGLGVLGAVAELAERREATYRREQAEHRAKNKKDDR